LNEYLAAENRILKAHPHPNLRLSDGDRSTLAEIGKRLSVKWARIWLAVSRVPQPQPDFIRVPSQCPAHSG